jgi:Peptidase family S41
VYGAYGDAIAAHIPLVVLVDHGTTSAAEIVTAAALQDHGRVGVSLDVDASDNTDTPEDEALTVAERTVSAEVRGAG